MKIKVPDFVIEKAKSFYKKYNTPIYVSHTSTDGAWLWDYRVNTNANYYIVAIYAQHGFTLTPDGERYLEIVRE